MTSIIIETLWFFLPAAVANMAPVIAARYSWLSHLNVPIDGELTLSGKRLFGRTKTWRGLVVGLLAAAVTGFIQYLLVITTDWAPTVSLVPYADPIIAVTVGTLLGFGALLGDILKSFFKRRLNIASGKPWLVFDQIDYIVGASIIGLLLTQLSFSHVLAAIIFFGIASYGTSFVGVKSGLKKSV